MAWILAVCSFPIAVFRAICSSKIACSLSATSSVMAPVLDCSAARAMMVSAAIAAALARSAVRDVFASVLIALVLPVTRPSFVTDPSAAM